MGWGTALRPAIAAAGLLLAVAAASAEAVASEPEPLPATPAAVHALNCVDALPRAWPVTPLSRRVVIAQLQLMLRGCIDDALFLASFGALLLENEEPGRALEWLERSLLLDPGNLGARADHALALAALGEPEALLQLAAEWRGRSDIPPALAAKLLPELGQAGLSWRNVRLGGVERRRWGLQGEVQLLGGHESNLDRSPKLSELTLTIPEGPLTLPVLSEPRRGSALYGSAVLQLGYAVRPRLILRSGLSLSARQSAAQPGTDWSQVQWNAEMEYRGADWSADGELGLSWSSGPLSEPYQSQRMAANLRRRVSACEARVGALHDRREQETTRLLDASAQVLQLGLDCPLPALPKAGAWRLSLTLAGGEDEPRSGDRPGGLQKLRSAGLRLVGQPSESTRLELHWQHRNLKDEQGYSPLLENNAIRRLQQRQAAAEISLALDQHGWQGWTASLQWQQFTQRSNLPLFSFQARSVYAGLRWRW